MKNNGFSCRDFITTGAISSLTLAGAESLTSCETSRVKNKKEHFSLFKGDIYSAEEGVSGLLFSSFGTKTECLKKLVFVCQKKNYCPKLLHVF